MAADALSGVGPPGNGWRMLSCCFIQLGFAKLVAGLSACYAGMVEFQALFALAICYEQCLLWTTPFILGLPLAIVVISYVGVHGNGWMLLWFTS